MYNAGRAPPRRRAGGQPEHHLVYRHLRRQVFRKMNEYTQTYTRQCVLVRKMCLGSMAPQNKTNNKQRRLRLRLPQQRLPPRHPRRGHPPPPRLRGACAALNI